MVCYWIPSHLKLESFHEWIFLLRVHGLLVFEKCTRSSWKTGQWIKFANWLLRAENLLSLHAHKQARSKNSGMPYLHRSYKQSGVDGTTICGNCSKREQVESILQRPPPERSDGSNIMDITSWENWNWCKL